VTFLYVIAETITGPVKLGFSVDASKRLKQLQTGYPRKLTLYHAEDIGSLNPRLMEGFLHAANRHHRITGEWFNLTVADAILEVRHVVIRYGESAELQSRKKL
jgi:hypothetical protein